MKISETGWHVHPKTNVHGYAIKRNGLNIEWKVYVYAECIASGTILPIDLTKTWIVLLTFGIGHFIHVAWLGQQKTMIKMYEKAHAMCEHVIKTDIENG